MKEKLVKFKYCSTESNSHWFHVNKGGFIIKLITTLIIGIIRRGFMVEQASNIINTGANKKRMHMPHELYGKFSAKSDFMNYFSCQVRPIFMTFNMFV